MYNKEMIDQLAAFISSKDGNTEKTRLQLLVQQKFHLVKARSVFYCDWFAIRFCKAASRHFSNTVLALSVLRGYDDRPFLVCLVTPTQNYLMLANTTFLKKNQSFLSGAAQKQYQGKFQRKRYYTGMGRN
ncbi:MAG TPA: hypothetical protein H9733_02450 [Candidatus Anaerotignum merdipullorum]|nr:hypothetical protein [Candidatus Anaerotignum merdipullorum]